MKIVVICGMSDEKVRSRLQPLVELNDVEQIYLIRRQPFEMEKVTTYTLPSLFRRLLVLAEVFRFLAIFYICVTKKPDFIYAIYFVPHGLYGAIAGILFRTPVVQEIIGTDRLKVTKSKLLTNLLTRADHIGVRGTKSLEQLSSLRIPKEKFFIPTSVNVLDFDHFKPDQSTKIYDLIYCGRMDQNKQIDILIRAISITRQKYPDIRVALVGDGSERMNLETLCNQLNLESVISFLGNQPYQNIPSFLNQSRIFMMASSFEGLPVAMIEALSCGLPVVVPDVGDITDITVDGYNAWLIKERSEDAFAHAFSTLLNDQNLYENLVQGALSSRSQFLVNFSLEKAKISWTNILQRIQPDKLY